MGIAPQLQAMHLCLKREDVYLNARNPLRLHWFELTSAFSLHANTSQSVDPKSCWLRQNLSFDVLIPALAGIDSTCLETVQAQSP